MLQDTEELKPLPSSKSDIDELIYQIKRIFANIDYDIKLSQENNYQSVFYLIFQLIGFYIKTEYETSQGRIDAIIETKQGNVYIFEFKVDKSAEEALEQIKANKYAECFLLDKKPTYIIGVNFNTELRNIDKHIFEMAK